MVYQGQQVLMQGILDLGERVFSKSENMKDNGFSKVLNSKIRSFDRSDLKSRSEGVKAKPQRASSNRNMGSGQQPAKIADDGIVKDNEAIMPQKNASPVKQTNTEEDDAYVRPDTAHEEADSNTDGLKQVEELQYALDGIIDLLKKLLLIAENRISAEDNSSGETVSFPAETVRANNAAELDTLRSELENLLNVADRLEGTKTSEIAVKFAGRLIEFLDDAGFAKMLDDTSVHIDAGQQEDLSNLLGKMLNEAERAKMDITRESIGEIIIPAMNQELAQIQQYNHDPAQHKVEAPDGKQVEAPDEKQDEVSSPLEKNFYDDSIPKQDEMLTGNRQNESHETFVFTKPKEQKPEVSDVNIQPDTASFAEVIKPGDVPPADTIKKPVDAETSVIRQVVDKAETLISENKKEIVMQLKPESLGKITLRVIHERGEIIARFVAENDQVKSILESNMQMLRDSLQRNGVPVQSLSVSVGQQNTGRNTGNDKEWNSEPGIRKHKAIKPTGIDAAHETYGLSGLTGDLFESGESVINLTA